MRTQGALDHLRFFEERNQALEADVHALRAEAATRQQHVEGLERELIRVNDVFRQVTDSRSWRAILRVRRLKSALRLGRR